MSINENIESKYFIDEDKFNCPFCKNRGVKYVVLGIAKFDETNDKKMFSIFVECSYCHKISMHLTKTPYLRGSTNFLILGKNSSEYKTYCYQDVNACLNYDAISLDTKYECCNSTAYDSELENNSIDDNIILHIPTSFFTIDNRVPRTLRELINEAEKCIKNNCITGASACIRKTIYEFIIQQELKGTDYESKIKSLKGMYNTLDNAYVDILAKIQGITSDQVHEQSFEAFDSNHTKAYIELLKEIFNQVYVLPQELKDKHSEISDLFGLIKDSKSESKA